MKGLAAWLGLMLLTAVTAHAAALLAAPYVIMSAAMARISEAAGVNAWAFGPRVTPESQAIVRSSPDLAYAACAFDLSEGPVRIKVAPWRDLHVLAFYGDDTDAFLTLTGAEIGPEGVELVLVRPGGAPPPGSARVVTAPSVRGLVLDRRLAPTEAAFAEADAGRRGNACAPLSGGDAVGTAARLR